MKTAYTLHAGPYIFANESVGSPIVSTTSGRFSGLTIRQTNVWVGIPYAAPLIDILRWQKAQPYVMNDGQNDIIQDATHYGPACPQITRGFISELSNEDCLYLNVWAPRTPSLKRKGYPVQLWIHGGGFIQGSSSIAIYDGLSRTNAAIQGNNPFIMKGRTIANQGITDQRIGMKWVQDNIAQFGGDKNSVIIMGQSAGAFSVCFHIVSPLSAGLFRAAMVESGPCDAYSLRDKSFAYSATNSLASIFGCNTTNATQQLACLRAINSSLLVAVARNNVYVPPATSPPFQNLEKVSNILPFNPIVDGVEIPVFRLKAFLSGTFNKVPIIIGATRNESLSNAIYTQFFTPPTSAEDYLTCTLPVVTFNNSELQAAYAPNHFNGNYTQADAPIPRA
ncbi:unnamed protein product [Rotaria sordida]|uniref:Carboxylic ester hydrolase n=1 Tax=Rotaria sordida TaxID=392033 RepID=A0A813YY95_9BILA|nr:unnamed protein product [Rotaria sordida]CAF3930213.1 unnamed protein product [Rotaria sordida]